MREKTRVACFFLFAKIGLDKDKIVVDKLLFRPTVILDMFGDPLKARKKLKWKYSYDFLLNFGSTYRERKEKFRRSVKN